MGSVAPSWSPWFRQTAGATLLAKRARLGAVRDRGKHAAEKGVQPQQDRWGPFARLTGVISLRSCVHFGLLSFVPVWLRHDARHLGGGGQRRADGDARRRRRRHADRRACGPTRLGGARSCSRAPAMSAPVMAAFIAAPIVPAFLLIAVVGFAVVGTFSITVVLGQEYLPNRLGMASGVTLGAAIGVGGALAPALGALADAQGIETAHVG